MDRRTFLKSVPAMVVLARTQMGLSADVNSTGISTIDERPTKAAGLAGGKGAAEGVIKLNPPDLNKGLSVMQALKKRKSTRDFTDRRLTLQQLSDLLWAADGTNRPDGKRTSPAALAMYSVDIYAVLPEGVYLYDVAKHELKLVAEGDYRKMAGTQEFVYSAPLNLVYALNMSRWQNAPMKVPDEKRQMWVLFEVGFLTQNVNLYCASEGLGAVVRGGLDQKGFGEVIKVRPEQVVLAQTVGYPKQKS